MTSVGLVPKGGGTPEQSLAALAALGRNFNLDDVIVKGSSEEKIANLEEFRFFFHDGAQVETWVTKIGVTDDMMVQVARLRRAWSAVSLFYQTAEQDSLKVVTADSDSMLIEGELRDTKTAFWKRCQLKFPTEVHPADTAVSRVSRELSNRTLCMFNLWKVKILQFQLTTNQTKRKLGENLFTEEVDKDEPCQENVETYLDRLYTLLLAYAIAGVLPPQGAGVDASEEATLGADSAEFSYVGQGHHSHRLPGCAPFVAGHHCAADDMLPMYIDYIKANLHKDLMDAVGRREHWLDLHPRSMRSWAMAPMAILLGLEPPTHKREPGSLGEGGPFIQFLMDGVL